MTLHKAMLNPTMGQMDDLAHGEEVKLSNHHMADGVVEFHLTSAQMKKLSKAHASGKGATLKLSQAQIKHHFQHGSGAFSDVLGHVYNMAKPLAKAGARMALNTVVKPLANRAAAAAIDFGANKLSSVAGLEGEGFFGDALKWGGHHAVDGLVGLTGMGVGTKSAGKGVVSDAFRSIGLGVGAKKPRKQAKGKGIFGDVGKFLGHAAVDRLVGLTGASANPNPLANQNERIAEALFQKKVAGGSGRGLY